MGRKAKPVDGWEGRVTAAVARGDVTPGRGEEIRAAMFSALALIAELEEEETNANQTPRTAGRRRLAD